MTVALVWLVVVGLLAVPVGFFGCCCDTCPLTISFHVTDCAGADVSGADVLAFDGSGHFPEGTTDGSGRVVLATPAGTYTWRVTKTGYGTVSGSATLACADVPVAVTIAKTVSVCFHVTGCSASAVSSAVVTIDDGSGHAYSGTTDGSGNVCLTALSGTTYNFTVSKSGYTSASGTKTVACNTTPATTNVSLSAAAGFTCGSICCGGAHPVPTSNSLTLTTAGGTHTSSLGTLLGGFCDFLTRSDVCTCATGGGGTPFGSSGAVGVSVALNGDCFHVTAQWGYYNYGFFGTILMARGDGTTTYGCGGNDGTNQLCCSIALYSGLASVTITLTGSCTDGVVNLTGSFPGSVTVGTVTVPCPVAGAVTLTN